MKKVIEIGWPCSPSTNIQLKLVNATEVLYTYGGGMGGASVKLYATDTSGDKYTDLTGEVRYINPDYIVTKREVQLVKQVTDAKAHRNYREKKVKSCIITRYILLPYRAEYKLVNKYTDEKDYHDQGAKIIFKEDITVKL
ncbi:MAG: hypothetical protein ACXABD_13260 [Candidatus Thorarchaeota archaeon]|jgi:hypothetical protein